MAWNRSIIKSNSFSVSGLVAFLLLGMGFYTNSWLLFLSAILFIMLGIANNYYLQHVGMNLVLLNNRVRNRFFIGEEGEWEFLFYNEGLPIMRGELRIYFDKNVTPIDVELLEILSNYEMILPLSIGHKQQQLIKIPHQATKRGVARIRKMEVKIPHFFGFGETILEYKDMIKQEALVYTKPTPVKNIQSFMSERSGSSLVRHSLYDDLLAPSGTRDYVSTDSFNRIHWKASARMQTLQTKVYDHIAEKGWHLSLNVADGYTISTNLEQLLSSAAELAHYSVKNHIPFSLSMNIRSAGQTPFCYIPAGSGSSHLQKILEMLSLVDQDSNMYPYEKMLSFYERHLSSQPYLIHAGLKSLLLPEQQKSLQNKGITLLELVLTDEMATIAPFRRVALKGVGF